MSNNDTNTYNPFANAEAFNAFPTPDRLQHGHLGSWAGDMQVFRINRMQVDLGWCDFVEVWARHASADASTDSRTVCLHVMDVGTNDAAVARAAFRADLTRCGCTETEEAYIMARIKTEETPEYTRFMWVEDLS
jgi:hypothetical protein